jgi:pyruvate/2-oxoglutarate dehydrogenase complex dihydrolipoamide acyltransferase (E2) component
MKTPTLEQCQEFLDGNGPTNSLDKALIAKLNAAELRRKIVEEKKSIEAYQATLQKADLDKIQRESLAAKKQREAAFQATKQAFEKQRQERQAIEKRLAAKPARKAPASKAPAAPAARPLKAESTPTLARALKLKSISENDRQAIRAELEHRGVAILQTGYSQPVR